MQFVLQNQANVLPDTELYCKHWERILYDKCMDNTVQDIQLINMPPYFGADMKEDERKLINLTQNVWTAPAAQPMTFVYAAYLPPGRHQLLIYCPVTKRAFCQSVVIDLDARDLYPEFPQRLKKEKKKVKVTRANVWRKWREDS